MEGSSTREKIKPSMRDKQDRRVSSGVQGEAAVGRRRRARAPEVNPPRGPPGMLLPPWEVGPLNFVKSTWAPLPPMGGEAAQQLTVMARPSWQS